MIKKNKWQLAIIKSLIEMEIFRRKAEKRKQAQKDREANEVNKIIKGLFKNKIYKITIEIVEG